MIRIFLNGSHGTPREPGRALKALRFGKAPPLVSQRFSSRHLTLLAELGASCPGSRPFRDSWEPNRC